MRSLRTGWMAGLAGMAAATALGAAEAATDIVGMSEVVVTATRTEMMLRDTPEIVQVIDRPRIMALNPRTVGEVMEYSTGAAIATGTGSGLPNRSAVSVNGLPPNYTLVMIDGVRLVSDHIHTGQNLEMVSPQSIERIEVMRGAASAQYGTDAIGGVVNIVTRKSGTEPEGYARVSTGSHGTHESSLSLFMPAKHGVTVSTFAHWEKSDGIPLKVPVNRVNNTGFERFNFFGRADAPVGPSTRVYAWLNRVDETMDWRGGRTGSKLVTPVAGFEHVAGSTVNVNGRVSYTKWEAELNGELNAFLESEVHGRWRISSTQTLMPGVDARRNEFDRVAVGRRRQDAWGAFLQHEWAPRETFSLMTAVRQDRVARLDPAYSPKLSVMFAPERRVRLRASVGRGFHAPSLQELYEEGFGHGGTAYRFGNPALQPEYSTTYTAGVELQPAGAVQFVVYGFRSELDDMIVPVYQGPWAKDPRINVWQRTNIKAATVQGAEASVRIALGSTVALETGYTVTGNRDEATGRQLPYHPGSSVYGRISAKQPVRGKLTVAGFVGLRGGFDRRAWNWQPARNASPDDPNGLTTPLKDYIKLDAGLTLRLAKRHEAFVKVENILGQDFENLDDAFTVIDGRPLVRIGFNLALPFGRK